MGHGYWHVDIALRSSESVAKISNLDSKELRSGCESSKHGTR
jgi:hypothetical protein